jgi:hypothetical protein
LKSGSWFTYKEERVQGRDGMRKILQENPTVYAELEADVKRHFHMPVTAPAGTTNGSDKKAKA